MNWNGKPYHSLDFELKSRFGQKVYKIALDGRMTCPNRDGTLGTRGCIFCSEGGSGDFAAPLDFSAFSASSSSIFHDNPATDVAHPASCSSGQDWQTLIATAVNNQRRGHHPHQK